MTTPSGILMGDKEDSCLHSSMPGSAGSSLYNPGVFHIQINVQGDVGGVAS